MKKLVLIFILNGLLLNIKPQGIYFISGHPFRNISAQFPSYIYKYEKDSLIIKSQVSDENLLLSFIKVYPELNIVTALTSKYKQKENQEILNVIHINKPDTVNSIRVILPAEMRCSHSNLINNNKYEVYECFACFDPLNRQRPVETRITKEYCWNVYTYELQELSPEDYKNVYIIGSPASAIEGWDYINLYSNLTDGRLFIPVTADTSKRPVLPYELPDSLQIKKKKLLAMLINNSNCSVIVVNRVNSSSSELGESILYIYNKVKNIWYTQKIKGDNDSMRGFGNWIAGTVVSNNVKLIFNEKGQLKDKIEFSRISPGKKNRRQEGTKYGTYFDFRADFYDYYYPGILYLINVYTQQYIEWEALENGERQGDSEILLVQDEIVYYRINDKIYQAPIINGEKLGISKLLVQDYRVPDIHWAFISSN